MEQDQVTGGVKVSLWLATPVAFGNKVKVRNKVQFGNRVTNKCNVLSVEDVTAYDHVPKCHVRFLERGLHIV